MPASMQGMCLKKDMRKLIALLIAVLMLCTPAYAAVDTAVQEGSAIIISGVVPSGKAGVNVTLLLPKPNVTEADLQSKPLEEVAYYADETNSGKDGVYHFELYLANDITDTTIYVRVGEGDLEPVQSAQVDYLPVNSIIAAIEALNNAYAAGNTDAQNRDAVEAALASEFLSLNTTIALDDYLALDSKDIVCDRFIEILKDKKYATDTDESLKNSVSDIKAQFTIGVGLAAMDACEDYVEMDALINKYAAFMGFDPAAYNALDNGALGAEKQMVAKIKGEFDIVSEAEFARSITAGVGMVELNKTVSWSGVKNVVEQYAEAFGISLDSSEYKEMENLESFYKKCAKGVPYDSLAGFVDAFESNIDAVLEEEKEPSKPSNSRPGSGGGGSSGSGSRQDVSFTPPVIDEPNLPDSSQDEPAFNDLQGVEWAVESIQALAEKGVLQGDGSGNFNPNNNITRAEFVKTILTAFEIPVEEKPVSFVDVSDDAWYCDYVATAAELGIVTGVSDDHFAPNANVTREDLCVMVVRALEYQQKNLGDTAEITFTDEAEIADYAKESVQKLAGAEIVNGIGDGSFAPKAYATRAQAAKIIYALCK